MPVMAGGNGLTMARCMACEIIPLILELGNSSPI
jgi:hypothetical protein